MLTVLDETRDFKGTTTLANPPTLYPIEAAGIERAGLDKVATVLGTMVSFGLAYQGQWMRHVSEYVLVSCNK